MRRLPKDERTHSIRAGDRVLLLVGLLTRLLVDSLLRLPRCEAVVFRTSPADVGVATARKEDLLELVGEEGVERGAERDGIKVVLCATSQ